MVGMGMRTAGTLIATCLQFWKLLMNKKDTIELAVTHSFTNDTIQCISCKSSDCSQLL